MKSFIKNFDIFSQEIKMTVNKNNTRYKNIFGGLIGILSIFTIIALFCYFLQDFFRPSNAAIVINQYQDLPINLDLSQMPYMFRVSDSNSIPINPVGMWGISLKFCWKNPNVTQSKIDVAIEPCDIDKHFGDYQDYFIGTDVSSFFCPVMRPANYTLNGIYGDSKYYSYYNFYVTNCFNSTTVNNCQSKAVINKVLGNAYLDMRSMDYAVNNFEKVPGTLFMRSDRYAISNTVFKRIWMYLKTINYISDSGLVTTSLKNSNFYQVDTFRSDMDLRDIYTGAAVPGAFTSFTIINSPQLTQYKRVYPKIQNFLANLGGVINSILMMGMIVNFTISQRLLMTKLINSTCDCFEENIEPQKINNSKLFFPSGKTQPSSRSSEIFRSSIDETFRKNSPEKTELFDVSKDGSNYLNKIIIDKVKVENLEVNSENNIKNRLERKKQKLRLSMCEYLIPIFCNGNTQRAKIFTSREELVSSKLSVIYIMNRFNDLNNIKEMLLSEQQNILMSVLPLNNHNVEYKEEDIIKSFDQILKKRNKDKVDKLLIESLGK